MSIMSRARPISAPKESQGSQKRPPLIFGQKTHENFHFYDYFVAPAQPLIVTEGHTDPVYLRNAIRRLAAGHGQLGTVTPKGFTYKVKFFNYENVVTILLRMGGSDPLKNLATDYERRLKRYDHKPMQHPVILLLDNDSGLSTFSNAVLGKFKKVINLTTKDDFYHLTHNLYVVKTPEPPSGSQSCIETLLGDDFAKLLDGKVFPASKEDFDPSKHIKKTDFARKVVAKKAAEIDWSGYDPLLARIEAVISHYTPPASPFPQPTISSN